MYCVKTTSYAESNIKKSRFIGILAPCHTLQQVQQSLSHVANNYSDASHIAFAFRIKNEQGIIYRFYDAGEPSGTAGKPILQHLEGKNIVNAVLAVVRYFGGVKLGAGGLTRAYSNAAKDVIETSDIIPYIELKKLKLIVEYSKLQALEFLLKKLHGHIIEQDFSGQVQVVVELPAQQAEVLLQQFSGMYL